MVKGRTRLSGNHAAPFEVLFEPQEKTSLMKNSGRTDGVRRINEHDIELSVGFLDKMIAIGNSQFDTLIPQGGLEPRKVSLANLDDLAVDFDHDCSLDGITEHLFERPTVPAADNEDFLRRGMTNHGWMDEHFVVEELIFLRRLDQPIEQEDAAKRFGLDNVNLLKRRPAGKKGAFGQEKEPTGWRMPLPEFGRLKGGGHGPRHQASQMKGSLSSSTRPLLIARSR